MISTQFSRIAFLFKFFNYLEYIKKNINFEDKKEFLQQLKQSVSIKPRTNLYSKDKKPNGCEDKTPNSLEGDNTSSGSNTTLVITHTLSQLYFKIISLNKEEFELISKICIKRIVFIIYTNR